MSVVYLTFFLIFRLKFSDADEKLEVFKKWIIPDVEGKKGENGKVGVIGGSVEYTGAPYFTALAALKAGADIACVITTKDAAPAIKEYGPDLVVHPILTYNPIILPKIGALLRKMDVVVIGPGLGRDMATIALIYEIIHMCRALNKPLILDSVATYAVAKNVSVLYGYPAPGVILTPDHVEAKMLRNATTEGGNLCEHWSRSVSVLATETEDKYCSAMGGDEWQLTGKVPPRLVVGQENILPGVLATFYAWAIKSRPGLGQHYIKNRKDTNTTQLLGKRIASYVAAKFTRTCNAEAFRKHGRSMVASNMLDEFHSTYELMFNGLT